MAYLDPPDTVNLTLTHEGRSLLARVKNGHELIYRIAGWQLGRGGYLEGNPVHTTPILDPATESEGFIEVLDNSDWEAGDQIILNGKSFIRSTHWVEGLTAEETVENIVAAVNDSKDLRHHRLVLVDVDPANASRIRVRSLVAGNVLQGKTFFFNPADVNTGTGFITLSNHGFVNKMRVEIATTGTLPNGLALATPYFIVNATTNTFQLSTTLNSPTLVSMTTQGTGFHAVVPTGNLFPIDHAETLGLGDTVNFEVTPMSLAVSTTLEDPAYPVPPTLGAFTLPDGRIEQPTSAAASFVVRIPDGLVGLGAYGELGLWVEVLESNHPMEKGRKTLYAHGHFPIVVKNDRTLFNMRAIINY